MGIRPFSWGCFGRLPEAPEYECSGDFNKDKCTWCDNYGNCMDAEYVDDFERFADDDLVIDTDDYPLGYNPYQE